MFPILYLVKDLAHQGLRHVNALFRQSFWTPSSFKALSTYHYKCLMCYIEIWLNWYQFAPILKQNWLSKCLAAILDAILQSDVIPLIRLLQQVGPLSKDLDEHFGI